MAARGWGGSGHVGVVDGTARMGGLGAWGGVAFGDVGGSFGDGFGKRAGGADGRVGEGVVWEGFDDFRGSFGDSLGLRAGDGFSFIPLFFDF